MENKDIGGKDFRNPGYSPIVPPRKGGNLEKPETKNSGAVKAKGIGKENIPPKVPDRPKPITRRTPPRVIKGQNKGVVGKTESVEKKVLPPVPKRPPKVPPRNIASGDNKQSSASSIRKLPAIPNPPATRLPPRNIASGDNKQSSTSSIRKLPQVPKRPATRLPPRNIPLGDKTPSSPPSIRNAPQVPKRPPLPYPSEGSVASIGEKSGSQLQDAGNLGKIMDGPEKKLTRLGHSLKECYKSEEVYNSQLSSLAAMIANDGPIKRAIYKQLGMQSFKEFERLVQGLREASDRMMKIFEKYETNVADVVLELDKFLSGPQGEKYKETCGNYLAFYEINLTASMPAILTQKPASNESPFSDLIAAPVQRGPRYKLLLEAVNTENEKQVKEKNPMLTQLITKMDNLIHESGKIQSNDKFTNLKSGMNFILVNNFVGLISNDPKKWRLATNLKGEMVIKKRGIFAGIDKKSAIRIIDILSELEALKDSKDPNNETNFNKEVQRNINSIVKEFKSFKVFDKLALKSIPQENARKLLQEAQELEIQKPQAQNQEKK